MRNILKIILKANGSTSESVLYEFQGHIIKFTDRGSHTLQTSKTIPKEGTYSLYPIKDLSQQSEQDFSTAEMIMSRDVSSFIVLTFTEKQKCLKLNTLNFFPIIESLLYS